MDGLVFHLLLLLAAGFAAFHSWRLGQRQALEALIENSIIFLSVAGTLKTRMRRSKGRGAQIDGGGHEEDIFFFFFLLRKRIKTDRAEFSGLLLLMSFASSVSHILISLSFFLKTFPREGGGEGEKQ
jgi:hypothetical protein